MIRQQRMRVEHPVVIALGSNLGDRETTLRAAVADLVALPGLSRLRASAIVEAPALRPDGVDESAPAFLNAVVVGRTSLAPNELLAALARIEVDHGRVRAERWGDRTLDLDIVAMGALRVNEPDLTVPHPGAAARAFVLAPWAEIEPDAVLAGSGRVADLLALARDRVSAYPAEPLL